MSRGLTHPELRCGTRLGKVGLLGSVLRGWQEHLGRSRPVQELGKDCTEPQVHPEVSGLRREGSVSGTGAGESPGALLLTLGPGRSAAAFQERSGCLLMGPVPGSGCRSSLRCPVPEAVGLRGLAGSLALGKWLGQRLIGSVNLVWLFTESF